MLLAAAGDGGADLLRQPAARYEFHVSDVRAGRQSARVVPRPCRLPLDRLPRAARGGVRADGRAIMLKKRKEDKLLSAVK